jgi:hypothetical protein
MVNSREELMELGRGNVEANADWEEDATADEVYDKAYVLAFDKVFDACGDRHLAGTLAMEIAQAYAQP